MGFDQGDTDIICSIDKSITLINIHLQSIDKNIEQQNAIFTKICSTLSDISASLKTRIELEKQIHNLKPSE